MKQRLEERLAALKAEYEQGQKLAAELDTRQQNLRATLLRISGAIQVLEEELASATENRNAVSMSQAFETLSN